MIQLISPVTLAFLTTFKDLEYSWPLHGSPTVGIRSTEEGDFSLRSPSSPYLLCVPGRCYWCWTTDLSVSELEPTEDLLLRVSEKLAVGYEKIREGVDRIMSGYILKTKADEIKEEGRQEAVNLMNYLWSNGRGEDAKKASTDQDFLERLLAEFKSMPSSAN